MGKKIVLLLLGLLAAAQVVRPQKNIAPAGATRPDDFIGLHQPPDTVKRILENACYDCHSNHTRYPWYADVQPLRWWIDQHVRDGKRQLNFSEFGRLSPERAQAKLADCLDEVEDGRMPLKSYTLVHTDARLSTADAEALVTWMEATMKRLESQTNRPATAVIAMNSPGEGQSARPVSDLQSPPKAAR